MYRVVWPIEARCDLLAEKKTQTLNLQDCSVEVQKADYIQYLYILYMYYI